MKKLFTLIILVQLAVSAMAAAWDGTTAAAFAGGAGTVGDPYQIATAEQLSYLASLTTANANTAGKYYKLTADIDLNGPTRSWTPIGLTTTTAFAGVFDGDNHVITNIYINNATTVFAGLFGYPTGTAGTNVIIKNLTIASGSITVTNASSTAGAFAGRAAYTQFINCKNAINVKGISQVGGIVGILGGGTCIVEYCSNSGAITCAGAGLHLGGIAGTVGATGSSFIRFCYNTGAVTAISNAGGIAGTNSGSLTIKECFNKGIVSATSVDAGGIVGYGYGGTSFNVLNCYNTATVQQTNASATSASINGGILGYPGGNAQDKYFQAITNCYNTGAVTAAKTGSTVEAIAGALKGGALTTNGTGSVVNSYYLSTLSVTNANGGTAKTDAELKAGAFLTLLNTSSVWGQNASYNSSYPYLLWQVLLTPTANAAASITTGGFTASWTAVNFTINYDIIVYDSNSAQVGTTTTVTSGNLSTDITGLAANTTYTYKVTAKGDGTNTINSAESTQQSFTTLSLPILTTPTVNASTSPLVYGFTANWDAVSNAVSYNIMVYDATPTLISTTNAASGTSKAITGLIPNTAYTYTVTAIGDHTNYNNSLASSTQSFTTSTTSAWDGTTAASFAGGSGTSIDPYQIVTVEQLSYLASLANATQTSNANTAGKYYKLTADIDLNGPTYSWSPIGTSATTAFAGVFDGNNHVITNITISNSTSGNPQGLFGWVQGTSSTNLSAIIKNITIGSGSVTTTYATGTTPTAALVGRCVYTQLSNCKNMINVTGYTNAGGIAGRVDGVSTIDGCSNVGTIKSTQNTSPNTGGIVGSFTGLTTNGGSDVSYIRSCYNRGAISSPNYVGGIVGNATGNITIDKCFNTGTINGSTNGASGGIVGYGYNTGTNQVAVLNISNSYNTGAIKATTAADATKNIAGGILGFVGGTSGRSFGTILNCYNIGTITGYISEPIAGQLTGIGGITPTGTVTNTYFLASSGTNTIASDGTSVADVSTLQGYASTLDGTKWSSDVNPNKNAGYPILTWQTASTSTLLAPTIGTASIITTTGFTANWTASANALGYTVSVFQNGTTFVQSSSVTGQATGTLAITGLTANTNYMYKVSAISNTGTVDSNESSASAAFTTQLASTAPVSSAATSITSTGFTANWSAVAGTGTFTYTLEYATNSGFTANKLTQSGISSNNLFYNVTSLNPNTTYYYRVKAVNANSSTSTSTTQNLTTLPNSPTITSFTPTSAGSGANVVITGTNLTGASAVSFGGTAPTSYTVDSDSQITAVVAAGTSGSVSVTTTGGTGTKTGFTFVAASVAVEVSTLNPTLASLNLTTSSDITIKSTGTLTVNAPIIVNSIALDSVGKLNVASGNTVSVGTLTLKAGITNSFSAKIDETITATTLRFVKTMDDKKWYFMSFPCNVVVADIISLNGALGTYGSGGSWFIKEYNGLQRAISGTSITNWNHVLSTATLAAKQGYIFGLADGMGTKDVIFPLASGILAKEVDATIPATAHTGAAGGNNFGWNLVGQPYLSKFTGSGAGINYMVFSDGISNYTQYSKFSATKPLPSIDPFAAYFVQVDNSNPISFALTSRQGAPAVANSLSDIVDLNISSASGIDNTTIIMDNDQSTAYQIGQDLEKWMSTGTQVYTVLGGINYAYNALPMSSVNNLPVGIYAKTTGTTTISANASQAQSLSKLLLTDNSTSPATVTDLLVSNYTFTASAGTNNTRFAITAQRVTTDNNVIDTEKDDVYISMENGKLSINNLAGNSTIRVFDALGRMIISKNTSSNVMEIKLGARGIYTVQLQSGSTISTRKVIF